MAGLVLRELFLFNRLCQPKQRTAFKPVLHCIPKSIRGSLATLNLASTWAAKTIGKEAKNVGREEMQTQPKES